MAAVETTTSRSGRCLRTASSVLTVLAVLIGFALSTLASSPAIVGSIAFDGNAIAVAASGDLVFIITADESAPEKELTLEIVSVADPRHPVAKGSIALGRAAGTVGVIAVGRWVFVQTAGAVHAFDVTDPANPKQVDIVQVPEAARPRSNSEVGSGVSRHGDLLFVATNGDISAERLRLAGPATSAGGPLTIPTPGEAQDVVALGDFLFVADGPTVGVTVIRLAQDLTTYAGLAPAGSVSIPTPGSAEAVAVSGALVLVADGLEGLTVIGGPIPPGAVNAVLPTPERAVDVATTRDLAIVATEEEGIQIVALPMLDTDLVMAEMIPERVTNVRVTNISPDTAGTPGATYTVTFTLPVRAGLSGDSGDTVTVAFPTGFGLGSVAIALDGVTLTPENIKVTAETVTVSLPEDLTILGGSSVTLTSSGVLNPSRGANYALTVATSASPTPVPSDPFAVSDNLLAWLNANLGPNLAAIARDLAAINTSLTLIQADVEMIEGDIGMIQGDVALVLAALEIGLDILENMASLLEDVNTSLETKIQLEEVMRNELETLGQLLLEMHDYLYEKLHIERGFEGLLETLADSLQDIHAGLEEKIDLEIAMRDAIDGLWECLRQLELNGRLTPPPEPRSPIDVVLALDSSQSMTGSDPEKIAINGARLFIGRLDSTKDRVGVVSWDDDIDFFTALSNDLEQAKRDLGRVDQSGSTNLDAGLREALRLLKQGAQSGGRKVIVFLTDGDGIYTSPGEAGSVVDQAKAEGVVIYAIGLGAGPVMAKLNSMAQGTGGKAFHARQAGDLVDVYTAIAQELMNPWQVQLKASCP